MKNSILVIITLLFFYGSNLTAQLSSHRTNEDWFWDAGINFVTLSNKQLVVPQNAYKGDKFSYFGVHMMFSHDSYEQWGFRYHLDMKWFPDLSFKAVELFKETGTTARIDFSGITSHKIGVNVFGSDNLAVGLGGSFCDYIVDIPNWKSTTNFNQGGYTWQEPSGWHWTAGPALFVDGGLADFAVNVIMSYDISYLRPKITDEYEANVDKYPGGYPRVGFMYFDITINHQSGLYLSYDRTSLIDKGVNNNKLRRGDFQFGYKILL